MNEAINHRRFPVISDFSRRGTEIQQPRQRLKSSFPIVLVVPKTVPSFPVGVNHSLPPRKLSGSRISSISRLKKPFFRSRV
jgi:hypothetical protein